MAAYCRACGGDKAKHKLAKVPTGTGTLRVRECPVYKVQLDPEDPATPRDGDGNMIALYRRKLGTG
jgi:hypothetical protein